MPIRHDRLVGLAVLTAGIFVGAVVLGAEPGDKQIRAGMIGLDTSHVPAFARMINDPEATGALAQLQVVAGYPGGTDLPASKDRVEGFTRELRDLGIEIVETIPQLLEKVDVVLLESVDGRIHWPEARQVILAGKPLFIDKPVAGSLADAIAIFELAEKHNVPCFSCSSLRFAEGVQTVSQSDEVGKVIGCITWGSCSIQPGTPDLFFYGVHGVEPLFTIMGPGCQTVTRVHTEGADVVTGIWRDGRVGTYRGIRQGNASFGVVVFGSQAIVNVTRLSSGYAPLVEQIATFFASGEVPVSAAATIEVFAFMEAADESKRRNGQPVAMAEVMAKAREEARRKTADID